MKSFYTLLLPSPCRRLRFNISGIYAVPRIGLGYLSSFLKHNSFLKTRIWDIMAEGKWIPDILKDFEVKGVPDLVGIGATIVSLREAFEIASAIKARYPQVKTAVGGPGVSFSKDILFKYGQGVDFFIRGEGETAFLELVRCLASEGLDYSSVPRLLWKNEKNETVENQECAFRDLSDGIFIDYESLPMERYRLHPPMGVFPPATMIETARGCSYGCSFCCISRQSRFKDPALVEKEIRKLQSRFGIREVHFIDPTFTLDQKRIKEICDRISPLKLKWTCKTRVDLVPRELLDAMAASGCYLISFGVEASQDVFLDALHKNATVNQTLEAFRNCKELKIRTAAYLMIGCPGETEESVADNIRFVKSLDPDYVLYSPLQPDPTNSMTQEYMKLGCFTEDDLSRYFLSDEDNYFLHYSLTGEPVEKVNKWLKRVTREFYFRPSYVLKKLGDIRSRQDIFNMFYAASFLFKDFFGLNKLWDQIRK
jgi:anaerobic magnesium-protoporphyrin IX monomethyl ester cyclase